MKPLLIAVSLLVNAALVAAFALRPALVPPAFRDYFTSGSGSATDTGGTHTAAANFKATSRAAAAAKLWTALDTDDLATLVARLRAAGFPIYAIRAIVQSEINSRYLARMRALSQSDPDAPFWKATTSLGMDPKRLAEYMQLSGERSKLLRDLLGNFALRDDGDLTTAQRRQYGSLSQSKIDQIERINQDYSELTTQVRAAMNGITLPEDREKLALLDREKRADLAALLSPEELADYDMRTSNVTSRLRSTFGLFSATEDEFRTIYKIEQAYSDRIDPTNLATMTLQERMNFTQQRTTAQKEMEAQLQATLGDARYAEFTRAGDRDYQQLTRLAEQANLPVQAAIQAYNLRDHLSQESNRIYSDPTLTYDQKLASLQSLAQNTRAQLIATLGPTAGDAYLKSAGNWLTTVEHGAAITFSGTSTSIRGLPNPNAPNRPPGATGGGEGAVFIGGGGGGGIITTSTGGGTLILGGGATTAPTGGTVIIRENITTAAPAPAPSPTPTPTR